jgi:formate/nitrite transporter FocA (FNT family)
MLITYVIALGDFTHIIAGSVEALYVWLAGNHSFLEVAGRFFLPTLVGNVAGGTLLFAVVSYAQVRSELEG